MEESFELLSTMSPNLKGKQKTLKVNKNSRLALKKHFRKSLLLDKPRTINNEQLVIVDLSSDSPESVSSKERNEDTDIFVIESSDSEQETVDVDSKRVVSSLVILKSSDSESSDSEQETVDVDSKRVVSKCNTNHPSGVHQDVRINQWLDNVQHETKDITFYSELSTICDNEPTNKDGAKNVAAFSSCNDNLALRFDELFINKTKVQPQNQLDDDSFSLEINTSLSSKLRSGKSHSGKCNDDADDMSSLRLSLGEREKFPENKKTDLILVEENLSSEDKSINSDVPCEPLSRFTKLSTPRNINEGRRKKGFGSESSSTKTPSRQNIKEVSSILDSIYGDSWRKNKHSVLQPFSEPRSKKPPPKEQKPSSVLFSERKNPPKIKEPLWPNWESNVKNPPQRIINFNNLKKSLESPWITKLKGLADSDSDSNSDKNELERDDTKKLKGLVKVKARLYVNDDSDDDVANSVDERKETTNDVYKKKGKENVPANIAKQFSKKPGNSHGTKTKQNKSPISSDVNISTDEEYDKEIQILEDKRKSIRPEANKTYSFLESLSATVPIHKCDIAARVFRTSYKQHKETLTSRLFSLYNEKVFDNAIPKDTEIEWTPKLRKTAGTCICKKITHRNGNVEKQVKITLSSKVLDLPSRLRDTLIHEMCHAATYIVNEISDGHGPYWKSWALRAMRVFPELPPIKRCHAYEINTKYTYKCTDCGYSFGRHSKSLDLERKRCGHCLGKFEVLLNKTTKNGGTKTVPSTSKKEATGFALFVKENYCVYKDSTKKHGEVMKILGQKFAELKVKQSS